MVVRGNGICMTADSKSGSLDNRLIPFAIMSLMSKVISCFSLIDIALERNICIEQ